ncbi:MAG: alkaline phosphatase D family protein, partial [candidate division NC10 bacterium]|nr:alkaline phosphatase D family protein [candidate division NC10 bacterium]
AHPEVTFTHGVASGDVTSSSALLWTRVDQAATLTAEVALDDSFSSIVASESVAATVDNDFTAKVDISRLDPASTYFYRFKADESVSPPGTFRTAPAPETSASVRFAWSSDSDGSGIPSFNNFEVLDRAREENLDFWVYLGDTAYMDTFGPKAETLEAMRAKYKQNREFPALRDLLAVTSTYAIWDDHEVEDNFDGQTVDPTLFANGRQAFQEYMPIREQPAALGFFQTFRWGTDLELFILDERSFRSASVEAICENDLLPTLPAFLRVQLGLAPTPPPGCLGALHDASRTMLGSLQKRRLKSALLQSDATWKIIINEVAIAELFGIPYDRWEGYAAEREEILDFIRARGIKNVLFLTGDLHGNIMTDVRRSILPDPDPITKEFIAGPIAQTTLFESLVALLGSEEAANAFVSLLTSLAPPDCINLNTFAYGVVEIDEGTQNLTVTLKDDTGTAFCSTTLSPS